MHFQSPWQPPNIRQTPTQGVPFSVTFFLRSSNKLPPRNIMFIIKLKGWGAEVRGRKLLESERIRIGTDVECSARKKAAGIVQIFL